MSLWNGPYSLTGFLVVGYICISIYSLWYASLPSISCGHNGNASSSCIRNLVNVGDTLTMELWIFQQTPKIQETNYTSATTNNFHQWQKVETCHLNNITIPSPSLLITPTTVTNDKTVCNVTLPDSARIRGDQKASGPLLAKFRFRLVNNLTTANSLGPIIAEVPLQLTRIVERRSPVAEQQSTVSSLDASSASRPRKLLEDPPSSVENERRTIDAAEFDNTHHVPYFKYPTQPVVIRYVAEDRPYGGPPYERNDGVQLSLVREDRSHYYYRPLLYVDDNALQHSLQQEMAPPPSNKPPLSLTIQFGSISPIRDVINRQITMALTMAEETIMLSGNELDEFRYWLRDERLYRFFLTQIISSIHVWVDYLAFRDEFRFYRGKTDFTGISVSTVMTRLLCSVIIFLYLLDGMGTSWVVLLSVFSGVVVDAWKTWKLLRPTWKSSFPFVSIRSGNVSEQTTAHYDHIAMKYLGMFLYPVVIGWAIYALQYYEYRSWYSWLISNLANAVYTFGFIALCPQLYVNYRLKSVAHLPWKVFLYKIFNTFVDDIFAFLIDMPWKHRIMTLRDDVVFVLFLVQVYMYRVDKTRTNEFGYSYEDEASPDPDKKREGSAVEVSKVKKD